MSFLNFITFLPIITTTVLGAIQKRDCPAPAKKVGARGLAYNDAGLIASTQWNKDIGWAYDWGSQTNPDTKSLMYIPMARKRPQFTPMDQWNAAVAAAISAGSDGIIGFNEPDHDQQDTMSVAELVGKWKDYMEPHKCTIRLGTPGFTSQDAPGKGLDYMKQFLDACNDCTIDFVTVHWYGNTEKDAQWNAEQFKIFVDNAIKTAGGRPLWITEFGILFEDPTKAPVVEDFLKQVLPFLDSQIGQGVERYANFMLAEGKVNMVTGGSLNEIGKIYNS